MDLSGVGDSKFKFKRSNLAWTRNFRDPPEELGYGSNSDIESNC